PDHRLERARVDDEELGVLDDRRRRRARPLVHDGHLAEELARRHIEEVAVEVAHAPRQLDLARMDHEHLVPRVALAEQNRPFRELSRRKRLRHAHLAVECLKIWNKAFAPAPIVSLTWAARPIGRTAWR